MKEKNSKLFPKLRILILLLCAALLLLIGFNILRSYKGIEVNEFTLEAAVGQSIKIAVLSDLHGCNPALDKSIAQLVSEQLPDVIFLTGDMLNADSENAQELCVLVEELCRIAPVYFSFGNHELDYIEAGSTDLRALLEAAGAAVMELSYSDIEINGAKLRIGGMYEYAFGLPIDEDVRIFLSDFEDTDSYKIMLSHRPDSFIFGDASSVWSIDLVISGHNHGGQLVLPFLGGLYGGDQGFFPEYTHGIYEKDNIRLAITSGLGSHGEKLPRFNNPPEIMVLNIISSK